jgi:hypothetical protein
MQLLAHRQRRLHHLRRHRLLLRLLLRLALLALRRLGTRRSIVRRIANHPRHHRPGLKQPGGGRRHPLMSVDQIGAPDRDVISAIHDAHLRRGGRGRALGREGGYQRAKRS